MGALEPPGDRVTGLALALSLLVGGPMKLEPVRQCTVSCYVGWPNEKHDCLYEVRAGPCVECEDTKRVSCRPVYRDYGPWNPIETQVSLPARGYRTYR